MEFVLDNSYFSLLPAELIPLIVFSDNNIEVYVLFYKTYKLGSIVSKELITYISINKDLKVFALACTHYNCDVIKFLYDLFEIMISIEYNRLYRLATVFFIIDNYLIMEHTDIEDGFRLEKENNEYKLIESLKGKNLYEVMAYSLFYRNCPLILNYYNSNIDKFSNVKSGELYAYIQELYFGRYAYWLINEHLFEEDVIINILKLWMKENNRNNLGISVSSNRIAELKSSNYNKLIDFMKDNKIKII